MMMMIGFCSFLFSYCCCGNIGIVVDAFPLGKESLFAKQQRQRTLLYYTNNDNDDSATTSWSLEHDWALMDQVPKFTVGEDSQIRTFWTQLAASTPIFADKDPDELYQRCQQLSEEEKQQNHNNNEEAEMTKGGNDDDDDTSSPLILSSLSPPRPLSFGPSPPLLQNWHIEKKEQSPLTEVIGQTGDGRTIWLQYHCLGRLQGDPLSTKFAAAAQQQSSSLPGGFIESIGGRVYELGQPQTTRMIASKSTAAATRVVPTITNDNNFFSWSNSNDHQEHFESFNDKEKNTFHSVISAASTATFSAFLASTILSASLGYGTGMSIVSDAYSSSTPCVHAISSSTTASLHEKRASTEYKVLREQRLLKEISQRLEKDTMELKDLRLIENQMP